MLRCVVDALEGKRQSCNASTGLLISITIAHEEAYMKARVLHCDISIGNIIIIEGRGILIDWDLSKWMTEGCPSPPPVPQPNNCHFESGCLPGIYYTDYGLTLSVQDSSVVMHVCVAYVILLVVECSILAGVYLLFCSLIHERGY